jgi:hypothetical protein
MKKFATTIMIIFGFGGRTRLQGKKSRRRARLERSQENFEMKEYKDLNSKRAA